MRKLHAAALALATLPMVAAGSAQAAASLDAGADADSEEAAGEPVIIVTGHHAGYKIESTTSATRTAGFACR